MYPLLFRTVLSRMDPETAHHAAMVVIRMLGIPPFSWARARSPGPPPPLRPRRSGLRFESPFGVAAGFDKDVRGAEGLYALGFGHVEVGTLTAIPQDGNPRPRLFRLIPDRAVVNRMGFNNQRRRGRGRAPARSCAGARTRAVIGVNIGKSRVVDVADATADYVRSATLLAPLADYLVVNVSSPNTPGLRGLQAVETLRPLLEAVRDAAGAHAAARQDRARPARRRGHGDRAPRRRARPGRPHRHEHDDLARGPRDRSGRRRRGGGRRPVRRAAARRARSRCCGSCARPCPPEFCVISVGGVETAADVRERLDAGATLVQGYTAFLYRGPLWARQINRGLARSAV